MRGKTLETVPFQPYSGCTRSFLYLVDVSDPKKMATGAAGAAFLALFFIFFPSFIVKNRVLEMLQIYPFFAFFLGRD